MVMANGMDTGMVMENRNLINNRFIINSIKSRFLYGSDFFFTCSLLII